MFKINLKDKVVVITGAGGIICSAIAKELAKDGAKIALLNRTLENAQKVADEINSCPDTKKAYGCAKAYQVDVMDKKSICAAHEAVIADFGKCDILINGAGGNNPKATTDNEFFDMENICKNDFFSLEQSAVEAVFDLNFLGTFLPTQVFAKDMIGRSGCSILNISSMNAFTPLTKIPAYSGAKAAVSNFTQWLAVHFAPASIRVNAIAPGFLVTNQNKSFLFDEDGSPTARTGKIINATPLKRFGQPDELLGAVKLLISEENASFITGVVLPIDGGFNAYSGV